MSMTMKAILTNGFGGPEVLTVGPAEIPKIGDSEILIDVRSFGVNRADIDQRRGHYQPPPGLPLILGLEVAGVVDSVGQGVTRFRKGDRVMALLAGGGYAEKAAADETLTFLVPKRMSFSQAATIPEAFFTVWLNVFQLCKLSSGESLLVHGAAGGVGLTAIQLAKLRGAIVVATSRNTEKLKTCKDFGATVVIDTNKEDLEVSLKRHLEGGAVDVILDCIGQAQFSTNIRLLNKRGRLILIDAVSGEEANLNLGDLIGNCLTIIGSVLRPRSILEKRKIGDEIRENLIPLLSDGFCVIPKTEFPFEKISEAHRLMETNNYIGKIVVNL